MVRYALALILITRLLGGFWTLLGTALMVTGGVSILHGIFRILLQATGPV